MEDIEKDLDKVSGGLCLYHHSRYKVVEGKDGKFYVIDKGAVTSHAVEGKDGNFYLPRSFKHNTKEEAENSFDFWGDSIIYHSQC